MTNATHLHTYQCSFCRAVATSPILVKSLLRCRGCFRLMAFKWSEPIETDEDRAIAAQGIVFHRPPPPAVPPPKVVRCRISDCIVFKPEAEMIHLPGIGRYCSPEHAARGQREWDAFLDRLRRLKDDNPFLEWHGVQP